MPDWNSFWNSEHSIYVDDRHLEVHYAAIAQMIVDYMESPDSVVVDFGCGEALYADRVAAACRRLILVDAAATVRAKLTRRFSGSPSIDVHTTAELERFPDSWVDLVIMHSVAQYLTEAEFSRLLGMFRRLLRPSGLLVIGDVVPPHVGVRADSIALVRYGRANHLSLLATIRSFARTLTSGYLCLRKTFYTEAEMLAKLDAAGFTATRATWNIGPNPARMTFLARSS